MAGAKLIVIYPSPRDVSTFERAYTQDHAPMVTPQNFRGIKKFVASKVVGTADGSAAPFYRSPAFASACRIASCWCVDVGGIGARGTPAARPCSSWQ